MKKSLSTTTSTTWSHQGCNATPWRKADGMTPSIQSPKCDRTHKTKPFQRRYWPKKKQRSVNQAGRKNRCPRLAGKTSSTGRKTRTRNRKLRPAEIASTYRFIGLTLETQLIHVAECLEVAVSDASAMPMVKDDFGCQ